MQGDIWIRAGIYVIGGKVRAGVWHPQETATIFVGSSKGNICKIAVFAGGEGEVSDFLHIFRVIISRYLARPTTSVMQL